MPLPVPRVLATALVSLLLCVSLPVAQEKWGRPTALGAEPDPPHAIGTRKQLFLDRAGIESVKGLTFQMHSPQRDGRILVRADKPWERRARLSVYSSVLKDGNRVRLWYDVLEKTGPGPYDHLRWVGYAESEDGLTFKKPKLGLHALHGSKANNVVLPGTIAGTAVWIDPRAPAEHRYKTQAKVYPSGEFHLHSSPDGLRWKLFSKPHPGAGGHDTQSIIYWDPAVKRYALYTRYWAHRGDRRRRHRTVRRLEADNLLGGWDNQQIVMAPDARDRATHAMRDERPPVDFYGACVFPYAEAPEFTLMLLQAHWHWRPRAPLRGLGPSNFDVQLAVSRDGRRFQRLGDRRPFMANGPDGRFDSRYVWALPRPIRMGDELWIYYAGSNRDHDGNIDPRAPGGKIHSGIGRAVLRLDGFVSVGAGYGGGRLTTKPLRFEGQRLELNLATSGGGSAQVEILGADGQPLPGYSRNEALPLNGNSVRMPVAWKAGSDVGPLAGKTVRLRFHLQDCHLYAFQFRPERNARPKPTGSAADSK